MNIQHHPHHHVSEFSPFNLYQHQNQQSPPQLSTTCISHQCRQQQHIITNNNSFNNSTSNDGQSFLVATNNDLTRSLNNKFSSWNNNTSLQNTHFDSNQSPFLLDG
jgi:hypothetical protein